ncbi:MAG: archease [Candidatus Binatia bacterium]
MSVVKFEELDHTADVGLRVYGATFEDLLANAAEGMFSLIGRACFTPAELRNRTLRLARGVREEVLFQWLRALLREFNRDGFFPVDIEVDSIEEGLTAEVRGGIFDPARQEFFSEIKAVTYHGLWVRETAFGFEAEVIFDV